MDTYTLLREFADSWFLIAMFGFFLGAGVWAYWPSQRSARDDAACIPFRDKETSCDKNCETCACSYDFLKEAENG